MRYRVWLALLLLPITVMAADLPSFRLEFNNGKLNTRQLWVPAGKRFKIILANKGKTVAEFESLPLRKEKVLAPGVESFVVLGPLSPGTYAFYDEFHLATTQSVIIASNSSP